MLFLRISDTRLGMEGERERDRKKIGQTLPCGVMERSSSETQGTWNSRGTPAHGPWFCWPCAPPQPIAQISSPHKVQGMLSGDPLFLPRAGPVGVKAPDQVCGPKHPQNKTHIHPGGEVQLPGCQFSFHKGPPPSQPSQDSNTVHQGSH